MGNSFWKSYLSDFLATGKDWQEVEKPFPEYSALMLRKCVNTAIERHNFKDKLRACWHDERIYVVRKEAYEAFKESHPSVYKTRNKTMIANFIESGKDMLDVTEMFQYYAPASLYHVTKRYGRGIVKAKCIGNNRYIYRVKTRKDSNEHPM